MKARTPKTSERADLMSWFESVMQQSGGNWWRNDISDQEGICFGRTACEKARGYLITHENDVEGAKVIAATFCIDHYQECVHDSRISEFGQMLIISIPFLFGGRVPDVEAGLPARSEAVGRAAAASTARVLSAESMSVGQLSDLAKSGRINFSEKELPRPGSGVPLMDNETLLRQSRDPSNPEDMIKVNRLKNGNMTIIDGNNRLAELIRRGEAGSIGLDEEVPIWSFGG
ncbi:hypothetical protein AB0K15_39750 [Amycolatopsis sp. NPDC049253]|uniref:hypothetical protein n=1 Tax=Amycolatopsis sp. NPDC049253 TaxID=3155274 RepID=UPI0034228DFE